MNATAHAIPEMTDRLLAEKNDGIGWITFNNPARHNAVSYEMWLALPVVLAAFEKDPEVRVIVLKGAGEKAFVAGADISQFKEKRSSEDAVEAYNTAADNASKALQHCTKPTIAMVRGYCIGGGTAIAVNCDMRVAADDAKFGVPAGKLGLGYRFTGIKRLAALKYGFALFHKGRLAFFVIFTLVAQLNHMLHSFQIALRRIF